MQAPIWIRSLHLCCTYKGASLEPVTRTIAGLFEIQPVAASYPRRLLLALGDEPR
jgi:hypothetical protein